MVSSESGQLYTIEGFAAALIMVVTAYMVVNATSVYTAGDTHISDMQLEAMGSDALTVMGTPANLAEKNNGESILRTIVEDDDSAKFQERFSRLVDTGATGRKVQYAASYLCRNKDDDSLYSQSLNLPGSLGLTGAEHPVRVTKWMIVDAADLPSNCGSQPEPYRAVLVEVLLWLD